MTTGLRHPTNVMLLRTALPCLVAALAATSAHAQAATAPACNNLTRTLQQAAGVTGSVSTNCAQITVSVAGSSFSTPPSCLVAYTHYLESVYACGPAATGLHCNPEGYQADIKNYQNGACPSVSGLTNGMSWGSWSDVPANLVAIIQGMTSCVAPTVSATFDWSATVKACKAVAQGEFSFGAADPNAPAGAANAPTEELWHGNPRALFSGASANPFENAYHAAMRDSQVSDPLLSEVEHNARPIAGVDCEFELEVRHFAEGSDSPEHTSTHLYSGRIAASGAFDLVQTSVAVRDGETRLVRQRQFFDGQMLVYAKEGAPIHSVFAPSYTERFPIWNVELLPQLGVLHHWLSNPYGIPRFAEHRYEATVREARVLLEKRILVGEREYVDRDFVVELDARSGAHVTRSRILEPNGGIREHTSFSDVRQVQRGVHRPFRITVTQFVDGRADGRRVEWSYRIARATALDAETAAEVRTAQLGDEWRVLR